MKARMKQYRRCPDCREYSNMRTHKCPPRWIIISEFEYPDGPQNIDMEVYKNLPTTWGRSVEQAAERYAKWRENSGENEFIHALSADVWLTLFYDPGNWHKVSIESITEISYRARSMEKNQNDYTESIQNET